MDDWEENGMDSSQSGLLLSSFQRKEKQKNIASKLNRLVIEKDKIVNKKNV